MGEALPRGLPGALARLTERVSNVAERRDLPFHPAADGLFLADLHADTLLWGIDPLVARSGGHVDAPRLAAARMGLQVFAAPTWTPLPREVEGMRVVSAGGLDQSSALFPTEIWEGAGGPALKRRGRALRIARRFWDMIEGSRRAGAPCRFRPVLDAADAEALCAPVAAADAGPPEMGAMLSLEGLHWVQGDAPDASVVAAVAEMKAAGFRMLAPTHRFSNGLGGASENDGARTGLTRAGRRAMRACLDAGIVVDLAHAAPAVIRETAGLALSRDAGPKPIIISHCGMQSVHPNRRNLSPADVRSVASTGGLVGIGFWRSAMGWADSEPFEAKLGRIVDSIGAALAALSEPCFADEMAGRFGRYAPHEHVAFGSDFDGAVRTAFDITGVSHVVGALTERLAPEAVAAIAGGNARRVLMQALAV